MKSNSTKPSLKNGIIFGLIAVILFVGFKSFDVHASAAIRKSAIGTMHTMASIKWKPTRDFSNKFTGRWDNPTYIKYTGAKCYTGMPYSWHYLTSLSSFLTKVTFASYDGCFHLNISSTPTETQISVGNDCGVAARNAWISATGYSFSTSKYTTGLIARAIDQTDTIRRVGSYTVISGQTALQIVQANASSMTSYYKLLKPGDICVKDGHAILVVSVSSTGITYHDQHGSYSSGSGTETTPYIASTTSWTISGSMSFQTLKTRGYIPITSTKLGDNS